MIITNQAGKDLVCQRIQALKVSPDKPWEVEGKPHVPGKSDSQRAWFHRLCRVLGDEIGMTEGDVKDMVKAKLWGTKAVQKWGLTIVVPDAPSTEPLSKKVYTRLIDELYHLGSEAGVALPDPQRDL